jgi:hypothetical protein
MYTIETSKHFSKHIDPEYGVPFYVLDTHVAPQQQAFYFVNPCMSNDGHYLWFWCIFPPAMYYTLAVIDFEKDEIYHFPETEFVAESPLVDVETGDVYYSDTVAIYKRTPDPSKPTVKLCDLPEVAREDNARILRSATHLTLSPDKTKMFLDMTTTKGWIAGAITLDTGEFEVYCRPEFCRDHGQFNPVYPDLALMAEDGFGKTWIRTDENGVFMRLWTVTSDGTEKVWPPLNLERATHEWWSADGTKIYYCKYNLIESNNGICSIDIFTGEHKLVAPVAAWHGFSSADDKLFVFDENDGFYRGCASKVGIYNAETGKKAYIVNNPPLAPKEKPAKYHLDPHPRLNGAEKYITFSTAINGRDDLAVAKTEDIVKLTL